MQRIAHILIILLLSFSCSQKQKSQGQFKLYVGNRALEVFFAGGAYVQATDQATTLTSIYTLDSSNSVSIPYGTYSLLVVTFSGPAINSGTMLCGSVASADFSTPDATQNITLNANECSLPIYTKLILSLKQGIIPNWDNDKWDISHWGP